MKNKVIVLPGAEPQIPLVKKLKTLGYHVTVFNPFEESPAFKYADDNRKVDILDKNKCLEYAKEIAPVAILSDMCDIAMPTVAFLSEKLGLSSLGNRCASLFTDKYMMRRFCEQHKLPSPRYKLCYCIDEAKEFFVKLNAKCIIKPLDSNSSRGVFFIESVDDINKHFIEVLSYSKCDKAVLIEEYINGTEFTVDGVMTPLGHKSLIISEKKHYSHNKNIAYQLYFSYNNPNFDYDLLRVTNDKFVNLANLPIGCFTHAEYKFENGKYYLIEIGARGGGNFISSDIVPIMTEFDNYQYQIDTLINHSNANIQINPNLKDRCAILYFFDVEKEGEVIGIENEYLLKSDKILRYKFNFKIGDTIKKAVNDAARIGYYIAYANNRKDLDALINEINNNVKFLIK